MSFHKAETAFFVFIALVLFASAIVFYAYSDLQIFLRTLDGAAEIERGQRYAMLLFTAAMLLVVSIVFGLLLIYPEIRGQLREHGKLRAITVTLSKRSQSLEQAALTDGLTGMQNRRYFDDALHEYLLEFRRIGKPIGLMILDLDHFKQVNDTHGHDVGDLVLKTVAACLKDLTRYHDVVARLGGEEFAVVAPNMDRDHLMKLAERIRKGIAGLVISQGNVRLRVTSSLGLAIWDGKESAHDLYRRADRMLYQSKKMGRNRVSA